MTKRVLAILKKGACFGKIDTFRKKLVLSFMLIIFVMSVFILYSFLYARNVSANYNRLYDNTNKLNTIAIEINKAQEDIESYVNKFGIELYRVQCKSSIEKSREIAVALLQTDIGKENSFQYKGLAGMIETYSELTNRSVYLYNSRDKGYYDEIFETRRVNKFINKRVMELTSGQLSISAKKYQDMESKAKYMEKVSILLFMVLATLISILVVNLSSSISKPVGILLNGVRKMSKGNLDEEEIKIKTKDEFYVLASSFNNMKKNMRDLIHQLVEKTNLENKLHEEEIKNFKMKSMLNETELKVLQSQLNPHFLFNTLNTIARTAMVENADSTMDLIESTSELLRYNLGKIGKDVTLRDEIDNIKEYIHIQQTRFLERIQFCLEIDDELLDMQVPFLFLQPIVENAVIHGIEPKESGGRVLIVVRSEGENVVVEVKDNGVGISENRLQSILQDEDDTSLGLKNVKKRLEYFYKMDVLDIKSRQWNGTKVTVRIPLKENGGTTLHV